MAASVLSGETGGESVVLVSETPEGQFASALAAVQGEIQTVSKSSSANIAGKEGKTGYSYDYAPGESIVPKLYPVLAKHGLAFTAQQDMDAEHGFVLRYQLMHSSGFSVGGVYPLPDPVRFGPQDIGKATTYARRYALCAVTGLFPGGDDDDAGSVQGVTSAPRGSGKPASTREPSARAQQAHTAAPKAKPKGEPESEPMWTPEKSAEWKSLIDSVTTPAEGSGLFQKAWGDGVLDFPIQEVGYTVREYMLAAAERTQKAANAEKAPRDDLYDTDLPPELFPADDTSDREGLNP